MAKLVYGENLSFHLEHGRTVCVASYCFDFNAPPRVNCFEFACSHAFTSGQPEIPVIPILARVCAMLFLVEPKALPAMIVFAAHRTDTRRMADARRNGLKASGAKHSLPPRI
jgi:hypothetical protein